MSASRQRKAAKKWDYRSTSLLIPVGTTYEDWETEGQQIQVTRRSMLFWLGDWVLWGEEHFGEIYSQAVSEYSAESIQTAMRVCRRIPPQRRRDELGFSFHQIVASLEPRDQDDLLAQAVDQRWSREMIREQVAQLRPGRHRRRAQPTLAVDNTDPSAEPQEELSGEGQAPASNDAAQDFGAEFPGTALVATGPMPEVLPPEPESFAASAMAAQFTPDEAAEYLRQMARAALPANIAAAISVLLAERERLYRVLHSARISAELGFQVSPGLREALAAAA